MKENFFLTRIETILQIRNQNERHGNYTINKHYKGQMDVTHRKKNQYNNDSKKLRIAFKCDYSPETDNSLLQPVSPTFCPKKRTFIRSKNETNSI